MTESIKLTDLHPHPGNPRLAPREDVVEQIAAQLNGKLDEAHALIVRPNGGSFEIISGHHRALAAERAGIAEVPCWVREMSDDDAYMALALNNAQGELHPLEVGLHVLNSGKGAREYAGLAGANERTVLDRLHAAEVVQIADVRDLNTVLSCLTQLVAIHTAAPWAWAALVAAMLDKNWTVEVTRKQAARFKPAKKGREIPDWIDLGTVAELILNGRQDPVAAMLDVFDEARATITANKHRTKPLLRRMLLALEDKRLAAPSDLRAILRPFLNLQDALIRRKRDRADAAARAQEELEAKAARLRRHVSLVEWQELDDATRALLLTVGKDTLFGTRATADSPSFNKQENTDIEWAQWSWNPITGCKHDCPYCYAREMAISARYADSYPYGFEPMLRPGHLASPHATKVPKEAAADVRYRNVFTGSMADMWGRWVPPEWIEAVLAEMAEASQWNFLTLTKFPGRMAEFSYTPNVWLGTTVDMQARVAAAEKAFAKVDCAGRKWLSIEPMLEPLRFKRLDLFDFIVVGGASEVKRPQRTPEWRPPARWIFDLAEQWKVAKGTLDGFYAKTNLLGSQCREGLLSLGADVMVTQEVAELPKSLRYGALTAPPAR